MLAKINFLISVYCSMSFHTMQFNAENDRFSTLCSFPCFWSFLQLSLCPAEMAAGFRGAARLPQIMQCSQAKHRCVCVCVCVWAWQAAASEGNVSAQRSKLIPKKVQQQAQTSPHSMLPNKPSGGFAVIIGPQYKSFAASYLQILKPICSDFLNYVREMGVNW